MPDAGWELIETAALRATGFPIALLHELRFPRSVGAVREILDRERELEALREELLHEQFGAAVARAREHGDGRAELAWLSRTRRAVGRRALVRRSCDLLGQEKRLHAGLARWNALLERLEAMLSGGRAVWADELAERRLVLRRIFTDPRLQEAVFMSSPKMHAQLASYLARDHASARSGDARRLERRLVSYLQRMCAKNETQSFFGPIDYARIDPGAPDNLRLRGTTDALRRREAFATQWMAEELAAAISREPELLAHLRPRRSPLCELHDGELRWVTGRTVALDPESAALWERADGTRTIAELAEDGGRSLEQMAQRLRGLQRRRAIITAIVLPGERADVLGALHDWLADVPATGGAVRHWRTALSELDRLLVEFAAASLEDRIRWLREIDGRFTELCGATGQRAAGAFYADRGVLFEECLGGVEELVIGGDLARRLDGALQPALALWETHAALLAKREERTAREVLDGAGEGAGLSLVEFLRAMHVAGAAAGRDADELDELSARMHELVRRSSDGRRARLRAEELPIADVDNADVCPYTSLDVLLAAAGVDELRAGNCRIVLGEAHPQALLWVFPTAHFLPGASDAILRPLEEALARRDGSSAALAQIAYRRKTKIYPYELPGETIELSARRADCSAIPAAGVRVRDVGGRLGLWADDRAYILHPPLVRDGAAGDPLVPLSLTPVEALDIDLGDHTPRIEIDDLIYQRERWRRRGGPLGAERLEDFDLLLAAWRWKERDGLPGEVFVRVGGEPKPIYVDFADFFLVELLEHLARDGGELTITEMLPASDDLWLGGNGGPHCCELRTIAIKKEQIE